MELKELRPLRFTHVYKSNIWGGNKIQSYFQRNDTPEICAESWEVSAHPDGMSIVDRGPFKGRTLEELSKTYERQLLGTMAPSDVRFPLLTKIIDSREDLSVQVHPSLTHPKINKDEIKSECWHCIDFLDNAHIYAGLKPFITDEKTFTDFVNNNPANFGKALNQFTPLANETLHIPAGLVHSIGKGCLIYEVQQNSDTTYRFYDWDRVGPSGQKRDLHIKDALQSIDWKLKTPAFEAPKQIPASPLKLCIKTDFFTLYELDNHGGLLPLATAKESFHILFVKSGSYSLESKFGIEALSLGDSILIPASLQHYSIIQRTPSSQLIITTL